MWASVGYIVALLLALDAPADSAIDDSFTKLMDPAPPAPVPRRKGEFVPLNVIDLGEPSQSLAECFAVVSVVVFLLLTTCVRHALLPFPSSSIIFSSQTQLLET
jgi:hypothetical protein